MRARAGIRLGVAAAVAALVALGVPSAAAPQFGNLSVDTTADGNDGECTNDCTLREAVALADVNQGQWVSLPPGVYRLTLGPIVLSRNTIVFGVSFTGTGSAGARSTVIDARGTSGAFEVPSGSSATLAGLTVTGGNAPTGGGAFVAEGGQLSVYSTIFRGNVAAGRGGAIATAGSLATFNSTFSGNRAAAGGALASEPNGSSAIISSTFSGNSATGSGGAITAAGSVQMQRVTIAANSAPAGGGFVQESVTGANTAMWSVLLGGNPGGDCGGSINGVPRSVTSANLDSDGTCAWAPGQGTTGDARLATLENNGGPTDTVAIGSGSPAINAGDQDLCGPGGPDQRSAPAVGPCDIGAFEFGGVPPEPVLPPPVAGETVNVNRSRGTVRVKLPGSNEFFDLEDAQQVPVGSTFDTVKGRINLVADGRREGVVLRGHLQVRPEAQGQQAEHAGTHRQAELRWRQQRQRGRQEEQEAPPLG